MKKKNQKLLLSKQTISKIGMSKIQGGVSGKSNCPINAPSCWATCVGTCPGATCYTISGNGCGSGY